MIGSRIVAIFEGLPPQEHTPQRNPSAQNSFPFLLLLIDSVGFNNDNKYNIIGTKNRPNTGALFFLVLCWMECAPSSSSCDFLT